MQSILLAERLGAKERGPRKTWKEVVEKDMLNMELKLSDATDRSICKAKSTGSGANDS